MAQRFEAISKAYLGARFTRAVVSCDLGLILTLGSFDARPGQEVVLPSFTFNSTVNSVLWNRLRPRFVEIDEATFNADPNSVAQAISPKTSAILVTHVFGNPCNMRSLRAIAKEHQVPLIADAAHGFGSKHRGAQVGSIADAEVFSFSGTKVVTSAEGGLVATKSRRIAERISYTRAYGFRNDYESRFLGVNGKMSELSAALGCLSIPDVDRWVERRNRLVRLYRDLLGSRADIQFQLVDSRDVSTYKDFAILLASSRKRSAVEAACSRKGIQTKRYFRPLHRMDFFKRFERSLPVTERVSSRVLCLPLFNEMSTGQVRQVAQTVLRA